MDTLEKIKQQLTENKIVLYMKGTPTFPRCGFSAKAVAALIDAIRAAGEQFQGDEFFSVDVLENPDIRQTLPEYANWPTFPQLYIEGELVGGCDIVAMLHEQGELQRLVKQSLAEAV